MKRNIVIAAVTATALIGGGAAVAFADGDAGEARAARGAGVAAGDDTGRAPASKLTVVQAIDAALKAQPGTVVSADLDDERDDDGEDGDDGNRVDDRGWEVDILGSGRTVHTVHVDPATGKILGTGTDRDEDDAVEARGLLKGADVDAREAAEAAAAAAKGVVRSVDLDDDEHGAGWSVEIAGSDQDWQVDLRTGKATAERSDSDDASDED
ncbi:PepSY domain-containing protein [Streptomyces sp.]|uniref:PepSY domain-containing protein n=1 Tax=Streptomyces sp. TaxID=1931 RepID=UPI002D246E7D|nr:PepSY domain-containing protein [Streptomyces sp.]HZF93036.1 PepSY domain-containing protein [Streptomyces sp.]